jgi:hypothetical protein
MTAQGVMTTKPKKAKRQKPRPRPGKIGELQASVEDDLLLLVVSDLPVTHQTEDFVPIGLLFARQAWIVPSAELAATIVLQRQGPIVIMDRCKLSSRQRVEWTACAVLPKPGIVG